MKTIKVLFFIIILVCLGLIGYQNSEYFLTTSALHLKLDLFSLHYEDAAPALPNYAYWGICFGLGLLIIGMRGLFTAFRLGREIKTKDARIDQLKAEINTLKANLEIYTHDPYIKKQLEEEAAAAEKDTAEKEAAAEEGQA